MYPGTITERKGLLRILLQTDQLTQGFVVVDSTGTQVGVYLDDSTPDLAKWVAIAYGTNWTYKFVSVPMGKVGHHWPGMINLLEWYPYHAGWNPGRMPGKYAGYILQALYPGYIIEESAKAKANPPAPPTPMQRRKILLQALLHRPEFIFYF